MCAKRYDESWISGGDMDVCHLLLFFQAEDGIRDLVRSRGLGDVYKRQILRGIAGNDIGCDHGFAVMAHPMCVRIASSNIHPCLLYTSDAADELLCVDLGGRRILQKKKNKKTNKNNNHPTCTCPTLHSTQL